MNRLISYTILTCFFSCLAYSQDCNLNPRDNEILVIGINGFGNNNSEALKDAKRNAITQAVGSYIQSETTINQSKLENDKIHEYGKGLIQEHCVVDSREAYNQYSVTIDAIVAKEKIIKTLMQSGVEIVFTGEDIAAAMKSELDRIDNESKQIDIIMSNLNPGPPFVFSLKELGVREKFTLVGTQQKIDRDNKTLKIAIAVKPNYSNYFKNLENSLKHVADKKISDDIILAAKSKSFAYFPFSEESEMICETWTNTNKIVFINDIYDTFSAGSLNKYYKGDKKRKKANFLKMFRGTNYHANATIMTFYDPAVYQKVLGIAKNHISTENFNISFLDKNGNHVIPPIIGVYDNINGNITIDENTSTIQGSTTKEKNTYYNSYNNVQQQVSYMSTEYTNKKKSDINKYFAYDEDPKYKINYYTGQTQLLPAGNFLEYVTNERGTFNKQLLYSSAGIAATVYPHAVAKGKQNAFNNSNVQTYGFSSTYNPFDNVVLTTGVIAAIGGIGFGTWLTTLFFSPRKVLKTNPKEQVAIFNSDTDFLSDNIALNAEKMGKIESTHEIYNWNIFREPNNTLGVFYIEVPLQLGQVEKIERIEIQ